MRWLTVRSRFSHPPQRGVVRHRRRGRAAALVALALLATSVGSRRGVRHPRSKPPTIRKSSATGTRSPSTRSSSTPERPMRKRSCGSRSSRLPCTTPLSVSPGATSSTTGTIVGRVGRHRRPPPQSPRMTSCSSTSRRRRVGWTPRWPHHSPRSPMGRRRMQGIRYGERAADRLIELRVDDGRFAPITFDVPPAPGVWRPTPAPTSPSAPFFDPWLSQLRPLLLDSPSQFRPGPPPALTSRRYADDFNEVKAVGSAASTVRTPEQTATALFIAGSTFPLATSSLRDLAARYQLDISDSARLFAAVDMSAADAVITSWDSKFEFGLWRPVTAIQLADTDGNPDTQPDHGLAPAGSNSAIPRLHERSHHDHGRNDPRLERSSRTWGRPHRREHHGGRASPATTSSRRS